MENRVGFWPRVAAAFIDFVIVAVVCLLAKGLVDSLLPEIYARKIAEVTADPRTASMRGFLTGMAAWGIAAALVGPFYGLIEGFTGASPGKYALGLRVVDEAGKPASLGLLLTRYLVKSSSALVTFIALFAAESALDLISQITAWVIGLGCFLVLTKARQALHDKIAGTAILRRADIAVPALASGPVSHV